MGDGSEFTGMSVIWGGAFAALGVVTAIFPSVYTIFALGLGLIGAACWRVRAEMGLKQDDDRSR